jgi:creatinine amidohydrolase/Fe(II)-dependent formamide hydrolase-like protein
MTSTAWAELTTEEVAGCAAGAVAIQPIGAVEQHGAHLPLITDALLAESAARAAAGKLATDASAWVLPTLCYGKSTEHLGRPGTVSLSTSTLLAVCMDVGESIARSGVRKLIFVNGHGGQPGLLDVVARDIRYSSGLNVHLVTLSRLRLPESVHNPGPGDLHGGFLETSLMLAMAPHLVHMDRASADGAAAISRFRAMRQLSLEGAIPTAWLADDLSASGVIGDPTNADGSVGALIMEHWSTQLAQVIRDVSEFEFPAARGSR